MKSGKTIWLFVIMVVIVPIAVYGITSWYESHFRSLPILGPEKHQISDFSFQDQHGEMITKENWKGKIVLAGYFFTSCSSVCPKMIAQVKRIEPDADKYLLINFFTVDPKRDSVGRLRKYADRNGINSNWFFLTGDKISLYRFARKDLMIEATDGDGGPGDFIHSDNLVLIDPQQRIRGYYKGTDVSEMDRLQHDIDKLKIEFKL